MSLVVVTILDADGDKYDVVLDDISSQLYPIYKQAFGAAGAATLVSAANPLPVDGSNVTQPVKIADGANLDAFSRLRVSNPLTIFDSKLLAADKQPLFWDESLESGAGISSSTPTAAKPYTDFTSTVSTAGTFTRQTYRRFNYQPGKSQLILMTGVLDLTGGGTGVQRRIGYFDDNNGLFFEDNEGTVQVVVRTSDSGTPDDTEATEQASWNIDAMDGSGPSGKTVNWAHSQIFVIDFQWLAIGRIRFGLDIDGVLYYVHEVSNANSKAIPWASTPNLPLRYQMITTGSSAASSMRCICAAVISEGGADPPALTHSHANTDVVNANSDASVYALIGIRLKSAQLGCTVTPVRATVLSSSNDNFEWRLIFNPTVAGTFNYSDKSDSCVQTATGGTIIDRGFGVASLAEAIDLGSTMKLGAAIDGTQDTLVLAVRPLSSMLDVRGSLTWSEMN